VAKAHNHPNRGNGKGFRWIVAHLDYQGDDCIQWPFSRLPQGRGIMGHAGKRWHASRLMCTLAHGEPPTPEHQAAHSCGNGHKACMNPKHLSWKTPSENRRDCKQHGTNSRGGARKLNPKQAAEIRALQGAATGFEVAARFGVHPNTIYMVWQRKTWAAA
jgi:hypothetical protein